MCSFLEKLWEAFTTIFISLIIYNLLRITTWCRNSVESFLSKVWQTLKNTYKGFPHFEENNLGSKHTFPSKQGVNSKK